MLHYESEQTIRNYRTAKFPEMENRELQFPLHIAYSHEYTRVHFWFAPFHERDREPVRTLIAHAGEHLPIQGY